MSTDMLVSLRALIVDDQRTMRSIVRTLLAQVGITDVAEAADGTEAIELLETPGEAPPDFVICDLHMSDGDGMAFCNKLRRHKNSDLAQIPVLILTGDSDGLLHEVAMQIGAANVLTKPISAPDLGREISRAVGFAA
ncbi:MAG: response regulator [Alphaproteobacteria bacterium]|jgi:two-component system chemotaxis response regulator CheY|nr:response regulator [Alphaproteobacteria bacterium]MDP6829383.1 response regulator [Alphaproteobacteria bacterium]MDP6874044.1 response regulator [Alphaproteobacteria bacterium]